MTTTDEIKKILEPHFGHLDFLVKIKTDQVSIEDIETLVDYIKKPNIISSLPKVLHDYNSYYILVKDLYFTNENLILIRNIKDIASTPKKIIFELLSNSIEYKNKLNKIIKDEELREIFFKWSSRINDRKFAINYIDSIINNPQVMKNLDSIEGDIIELKDFNESSKLIPASWCTKSRNTFDNYLVNYRMFIFKLQGSVYGINVAHNNNFITVFSERNQTVSDPFVMRKANEAVIKCDVGIKKKVIKEVVSARKNDIMANKRAEQYHFPIPIMVKKSFFNKVYDTLFVVPLNPFAK